MDAPDERLDTIPVPPPPPPPPTMLRTPLPPPPPLLRRRNLTNGWRWTLAFGWGAVIAGLLVLYYSAVDVVGQRIVWFNLMAVPVVLPAIVIIAIGLDWKATLPLSALATGSVGVLGVLDLSRGHHVVGLAELALAGSGLAITLAALAGRYHHQPFVSPPANPPGANTAG